MPFASIAGPALGGLAAGVGGSVVSGLLSPSTSGGTNGSGGYYVPTDLAGADTTWQNLLNSIYGQYSSTDLAQYGQDSLDWGLDAQNQYGGAYQTAANTAGQGYTNAGTALTNLGNSDLATQQQLLGAGQQVMNMGLDSNQALYNQNLNAMTQQTGATNSMYGLGSSAAGAGVQNQALSNFNIDWNAQQLQNAEGALSAYSGAANTAGSYGQAGASDLSTAPQLTLAGGSTPYTTGQTIAGMTGQLGNTYGSYLNSNVYGPAEGIQNNIGSYLYQGQGAQAVPYQAQAAGAGAAGSMVSSGIGSALQNSGALSNLFGSSSMSSLYGPSYTPAVSASPYYQGNGNTFGFTLAGT